MDPTSTLDREASFAPGAMTIAPIHDLPLNSSTHPAHSDPGRSMVRRLTSEGGAVFLVSFVLYFIVAWLLDLKYKSFIPDAVSREANGFYVLYSRDPHLAAVGFVWQPLQSMADTFFLLGNHLWPALSHNDMAGSLVSALAMAGTAYQIMAALREWGVSRIPRLVLVACFALNPMMVLYGGNGMSEGLYMFTLVAATRYLLRWIRGSDLRSLAYSAIFLSLSYLTRNEAAAAAAAAGVVVALISFSRAHGRTSLRVKKAAADVVIIAAPPLIAFAGWAIASYVIVGQFFAQLSSIYGNSAQVATQQHLTLHDRASFEIHSLEALAPFILVILVACAVVAFVRRDPCMLAPVAVLGGALGFDMLALLDNAIQDTFRYMILSFPLGVLLVGSLVAAIQNPTRSTVDTELHLGPRSAGARTLGLLVSVILILVVFIPTTVTTGAAIFNPHLGRLEAAQLDFIFHSHPSKEDLGNEGNYPWIVSMGDWFMDRHWADSDVVVDNFDECVPPMLTSINQPKLFVIPSDRDFQRILADPVTFNAHYILEANPAQFPNTSISLQYPTLWNTGAGFTKKVHTFPAQPTCPEFRLFRVLHHSNEVG
jgi:hypothetical protein